MAEEVQKRLLFPPIRRHRALSADSHGVGEVGEVVLVNLGNKNNHVYLEVLSVVGGTYYYNYIP